MLYKVKLRQLSESIGLIKANTLFGAFLTSYSMFKDLDKNIIEDIVLSDLFIADALPLSVVNNETVYDKGYVFNTKSVLRSFLARDNRDNNTPVVKDSYYTMGYLTFYLSTEVLDKDTLILIIKNMLILGLGKWRSVGKGRFELSSVEEYIRDTSKSTFVALADFIPKDEEFSYIKEMGYTVRHGVATNGVTQRVTTMLKTGTTFNKDLQFAGNHLYDSKSGTYIHGRTIVMGV